MAVELYSNLVRVTRTPWDVTLHFLKAKTPRDAKPGDTVDLLKNVEEVGDVTLPLEVAQSLIKVLESVTAEGAIKIVEEKRP